MTVTPTSVISAIQSSLQPQIGALAPQVFKNANMQKTLLNKLNAVIGNMDEGNYADALGQLQDDILGKVGGVAKIGKPDKNDWITDPGA